MRLDFDSEDERGFEAARDMLVERFEAWLGEASAGEGLGEEMVDYARVALDWKWSYSDGHLGRWEGGDLAEFLLEWCPRKLSVSQSDSAAIPGSLVAFMTFLDSEGLLAPGSSPVPDLADTVKGVTEEFITGMGDPSKFGLAKSLFGAATAEGVDLTDPDQMEAWIAEFNARPDEERHQLIPDTALGIPRRPSLPPVAPRSEADIAASQAEAPILAMFSRLASFVGDGRRLTQTGNLTLADARELVALLDTGDVMDEQIGDRTFKTKSSAELPRLRLVFAWAKKAGVLRVAGSRVIATKRGRAMAGDPVGVFDRAIEALLAIGPLSAQRDPEWWLAWPEVNELLDRFALKLLTGPYVAQRPIPIEHLAEAATESVLDTFEFPAAVDDDRVARRVGVDVVDIMDAFELAGVVRRLDLPELSDKDSQMALRRHGGSVELTPAGTAAVNRLLIDAGYEAPTAGRFTDATATELLLGTDLEDFVTLWGEVEAWRRRREPEQAANELVTAVRELEDPALQNLALAVLADMDPDIAGPEVRRLATEPGTRGFALCWLVDQGLADAQAVFDPDDVAWFVDVLAHRLVTGGGEALLNTLALAGDQDAQVAAVDGLWRSPSPATDTVLSAVGELHPVKVVAGAAKKASFQRRSWLGASPPP